jgi:glycosyltransferase involved in cell wall biosynthesis
MGTATHDADFAMIEPALRRVLDIFGRHVSIDIIGISGRSDLPDWVNRIPLSVHATQSYPGFVNWITQHHWDIGIAPLVDTPFNQCKSSLKTLDYAALGLPVLASDVAAYRGSPTDGPAGWLLPDNPDAWFLALCRLVRDVPLRRHLSEAARTAYQAGTLAAQASARRAAWLSLVPRERWTADAEREVAASG